MKHVSRWLPLSFVILFVVVTARPCSPDFPDAVFVLKTGPGGNYASYAAGHLGVPQDSYFTRHLVIAYDYLTHHPLSAADQKQAIAVNDYLFDGWQADNSDKPLSGFAAWIKARGAIGPVDGFVPDGSLATSRSLPGQDSYDDFTNCLDDGFATAATTLQTLAAAHGAKDPAVLDWVRGQDAVFTNCGDGKPPAYYGPAEKAPAPPPAPRAPAAAPASAPLWLQQDRAYQLAAASFYHLDFDDAVARFRAIAADANSPWSLTARYMIARTFIRKSSVGNPVPSGQQSPQQVAAAQQRYKVTTQEDLKKAQYELVAMQGEPRMAPMRHAVDGLLDYVNIRLQPQAQAAVLAGRLQSGSDPAQFKQALLDLTWLHSTHDYNDGPVPTLSSGTHPQDMLAWIDANYTSDEDSALSHWRATHATAWLVTALALAKPGDPAVPALLKAAQAVPQTDPGWTAVTYHRLRLSPHNAATRKEVLALLPQMRATGDVSTVNLFLALDTASAPTLGDWLATVARVPAGDDSDTDGEEALPAQNGVGSDGSASAVEDVCGKKFPANTLLPLFDTDSATVFNREMPLRLLAQAAESTTLPESLRFQVAQAAWTRAVLLDKPEIAHRMSPVLIGCRAAWKPVLAAYDAAATPEQRHAAGLLALMRFASTVPSVWDGDDRRNGFAAYDDLRQNWWCSTVPPAGQTVDVDPDIPATNNNGDVLKPVAVPPPPFLTAADLAEAHAEVAALEKIPRASTYFATQALAWQRLHPKDPQTAVILGEADRALRNACRKDPPYDDKGNLQSKPGDMTLTPNLAKALFQTLQREYPNSAWAKRYTSWE